MITEQFIHNIPPVYNKNSKVLILGSFPSVKSREAEFFYGHPQNRFWKVIAALCGASVPETVEQKKKLLLQNGIALWDVIAVCSVEGSADSSIKNAVPNDISFLLSETAITKIFLNGKTAEKYYNKYLKSAVSIPAVCLPSTSPANAAKNLETLIDEWSVIKKYL